MIGLLNKKEKEHLKKFLNINQPLVSLTVDGGYEGTAEILLELSKRYEIPFTIFLVTSTIGKTLENRPVKNWDFWYEVIKNNKWEIGSHTHTHSLLKLSFDERLINLLKTGARNFPQLIWSPPKILKIGKVIENCIQVKNSSLSFKEFLSEAEWSKRILEKKLKINVESFAYPGGRYSKSIFKELSKLGYKSARTSEPGINFGKKINPFRLKSMIWTQKTTLLEANKWIDLAIKHKGWLIETFHIITDFPEDYMYAVDKNLLINHLRYLKSKKNLTIDTQENIVNSFSLS